MLGSWAPLIWSLALLAALWWVSRQLAFFFVSVIYRLTRHEGAAASIYAIVILPGTLVHETSHWLMAKLVGVRTGGFTVLPQMGREGTLRLGAVDVRGGRLWQHTLIGLAPLLVCSLLTLLLANSLVDVGQFIAFWQAGQWNQAFAILRASLHQPDALLTVYLLFTVSDAMFLSASDRAPVKRMLLYLGVVLTVIFIITGFPALPASWNITLQGAFSVYAVGLGIALLIHLTLMVFFGVFHYVLRTVGR